MAQTDAGFLQLVADKAKETRPVVLLSPWQKPAYAAYLPVWTVHGAYDLDAAGKPIKDPYRQYLSMGGGGKYDLGTRAGSAFLGMDLNLVALSARLWNWAWADKHIDRAKFPPIYAGPNFNLPLDYGQMKTITLRRDLRAQVGIAYGFGGQK